MSGQWGSQGYGGAGGYQQGGYGAQQGGQQMVTISTLTRMPQQASTHG